MPDVFDIPGPASPAPGSAAASEAHSSPVALSHSRSVALPFTPSIEKEKQVLNDLACGDYSFVEIAQNHDTTVEALSAWMATDEVAQRLAMIESGPARQARLVATIRMPDAVRALTAALDNLRFEEEHAVTDHRNQRIRELRRRGADTLRKIVALLHRITKFEPHRVAVHRAAPDRATACSPSPTTCTPTSSAVHPMRPDTPLDPSDPSDLSALSANPPAPITPESLTELRAFLQTLLTPASPSATPPLCHSATSTPPAPPPQPPPTKPITWKSTLHSRAGAAPDATPAPITNSSQPAPTPHSIGNPHAPP